MGSIPKIQYLIGKGKSVLLSLIRSEASSRRTLSKGGILNCFRFLLPRRRSRVSRYGIGLALTLVAFAIRLAIAPLDGGVQYVTFFPAVALVAVFGGLGPGIFSAIIGCFLATYFFWTPYETLVFAFRHQTVLSNTVFLIDAVLVCSAIEAMHRYYRKSVVAEQSLRLAASVFQTSAEGIVVTDLNGTIQAINPSFTEITGFMSDEVIGQSPSLLRSDHQSPEFYRSMWAALTSNGQWQGELWNRRKDGEAYLQYMTIRRVVDESGRPLRYVGMFRDVTESRQKDEHIRHLAFHDALTGLPNRALLYDRLEHALQRARRMGNRLAVMFIDLDKFKAVNDSLGHAVGDLLLQEFAIRIKGRLRSMDTLARLGGDEFILLMEDVERIEDCASLALEIIAALSRPAELRAHVVQAGASLGIALFPEDGSDASELLKRADAAMYEAKNSGRNNYRFFQEQAKGIPTRSFKNESVPKDVAATNELSQVP